ncbi:MAG: hypothetical protein IT439_12895 [Phycisphaerales bacterium]|nr:hypothetical protein [Phycisphaerales bacterium]
MSRAPRTPLSKRLRRWLLAVGLAFALIAGGLGIIGWMMSRQTPAWWRSLDPRDPQVQALGENIENALVNELHRADRPGVREGNAWRSETWGFYIAAADANAWLSTRLAAWMENRLEGFDFPDEITEVQAEFNDGFVRLGARLSRGRSRTVISASLRPEIRGDGALWLALERVHIGRLPVPVGWVMGEGRLRSFAGDDADLEALLRAFAGRQPLMREPEIELGDGRRVRLLSLAARLGRLEITCRTEFERD